MVSVLFADLEASTQLATRLDPEDLREVLGHFFEEMAAQISRFGGTVEKFIGDAVVGVFGAPTAHDDDAQRAVRAGLAMQQRMPEVNRRVEPKLGSGLATRIAIHTGEVLASPGAPHEGTVTGEATTIAARLQTAAAPGTVVVSERTYRATQHDFEFAPLGLLELKGVAGRQPAWRVIGEAASRVVTSEAPLVGRRDELDLLAVLLRRCVRERRAYVVSILGAAGMGKTRLAQEFAREVSSTAGTAAPECRVVRGRCVAYGDALRFWPLAEIVKEDAGILDTDAPEAIARKASQSIASRFSDAALGARTTTVILSSLGIPVDPDPLAGVGRTDVERLIAEAWARYLESLAGPGGLLVLIEDLHWADAGLLDLLERLANQIQAPVLISCTARPELFDRRPTWGAGRANFASLDLAPLSAGEETTLIENLLEARASSGLVTAIVSRAEGNPFFASELLRMLRDDGQIELRDGEYSLVSQLPSDLPDTVQATIAARLDRLPPEHKRVIQDAAVVGRLFWDGVLAALAPDVDNALQGLLDRGLIRLNPSSSIAGSREYTFDHALIREVAYAGLPRARRREAHRAVLGWMESVTRHREEEFAELLAHHAMQATDAARTLAYALLAGHRHRRVYAGEEALRWYDRALAAADELGPAADMRSVAEILHSRGGTFEELGRLAEAAADYERELDVVRAGGSLWRQAHAFAALTEVLAQANEHARVQALIPAALQAARDAGTPDLEARLHYTTGSVAWAQRDWSAAIAAHRRALEIAHEVADLEAEAYARHGLAETLSLIGPLSQAVAEAERAHSLWRDLGHRPRQYRSAQLLGHAYMLLGRFEDARQAIDESVSGLRDLGQQRAEAVSLSTRALLELFGGDAGGALRSATEATERARAADASTALFLGVVVRMLIAAELGARRDVGNGMDEALKLVDRGEAAFGAILLAADGWQHALAGDTSAAGQQFQEARRGAETLFEQFVCARLELCALQATQQAAALAAAAEWLGERAAGQSTPHEALAAWAACYGDALRGALDRTQLATRLRPALESVDATVRWRALQLAATVNGDGSSDAAARAAALVDAIARSIDDEFVRQAFVEWVERTRPRAPEFSGVTRR